MNLREEHLATLARESKRLSEGIFAANTITGYSYDWDMFQAWCDAYARVSIPAEPDTVLLYLTDLIHQGKKLTTVNRRKCAIDHRHRTRGLSSPVTEEVKIMLYGACRIQGEKPRQMKAITVNQLSRISGQLAAVGTFTALRDRSLLVLGFATALRRSNLVALKVEDIEQCDQGLIIHIDREKQDQAGKGRAIAVTRGKRAATCPIRTLGDWLKRRGKIPGCLYPRQGRGGGPLDGDSVTRIVKSRLKMIGIDPDQYGSHSLRAGFVTAAGIAGATDAQIARQTGHRCLATVRRYFRPAELFRANTCAMVGL